MHDTPVHNAPNYGKPGYRHVSTCHDNPVEITMNLMDNTDDDAQYMFTHGQMMRMYATLAKDGGPRTELRVDGLTCDSKGLRPIEDVVNDCSGSEPNETRKLAISVYPNPASDGFTVMIISPCEEDIRLAVFNQLGYKQFGKTLEYASGDMSNVVYINARDWPLGMYVVQVHCGRQSVAEKVLLER